MSIVNYARVAALFSAFFVLASFGYSEDFFVAAMFIGAFALFFAAVGLLVWVVNRYERAAFVASLSQAERLGLWAPRIPSRLGLVARFQRDDQGRA